MQFEDPRSILEAAAAQPSRGIDPHALAKQGARLRRARWAAAGAGMAVVVTAASAAFGVLGGDEDGHATSPAAPSTEACGEVVEKISIYLHDDSDIHVRLARARLKRLLGNVQHLRIEHVGKDEAFREFKINNADHPELYENLPRRALPERLDVEVAREAVDVVEAALRAGFADEAAEIRKVVEPEPICAEEKASSESITPDAGDANGDGDGSPRPPKLWAVLRRAQCSLNAPEFVEPPAHASEKWCTFQVVFENKGDSEVALDDAARLLHVDDSATLTYSTAYIEEGVSPHLADLIIGPGRTLTRDLYFAIDREGVPTALTFGTGQDTVSLAFEYDCPADLAQHPGPFCDFTPRDQRS